MAGSANSKKLKLLYLIRILYEKTDEDHPITMEEILDSLLSYGIEAERKSIYSDIELLTLAGIDVIGERRDRNFFYHIGSRRFELAELKLLVDSVQSSRFITSKKSDELIKKIESLASRHEAMGLQRQVYVADRVKTENENILYNVDHIHQAIAGNKKISFQYFNWDVNKKRVFRRNGERYELSPWSLMWSNENYYLVAYDSADEKIKHFRVDKMLHIAIEEAQREGKNIFRDFNMGTYSGAVFGMFGGELENVRLLCDNEMSGVIVDRFGRDVPMTRTDGEHFTVSIIVAVSGQFFGWVTALEGKVRIIGPENVVKRMRETLKTVSSQYE
ncbi:MAG: WYL domain-containing protein [Lachnospiraceae bacterium]|nr:WYL domain-containing protein [Lachnospiraceae bacterium]